MDPNLTAIDSAIGGTVSITSGGTTTLTATQAANAIFILGPVTSTLYLNFPPVYGRKLIIISGGTTGGQTYYIRGNNGTDMAGVTIPAVTSIASPYKAALGILVTPTRVYWDGYETCPPGTIMNYGSSLVSGSNMIPPGWLPCDGSSYANVAPYDLLFSVITYTYGGSGSIFLVPDFRGRVTAAADNMLTPAGSAGRLNNWQVGQSGGEAQHILIAQEIPTAAASGPGSVLGVGSGTAAGHNNVQPTLTVSKLIRY